MNQTITPKCECDRRYMQKLAHPDRYNVDYFCWHCGWENDSPEGRAARNFNDPATVEQGAENEATRKRHSLEDWQKALAADARKDAVRDALPDLLRALDAAAHECANATADDLERLKDLAQGWAKLVAKYEGQ